MEIWNCPFLQNSVVLFVLLMAHFIFTCISAVCVLKRLVDIVQLSPWLAQYLSCWSTNGIFCVAFTQHKEIGVVKILFCLQSLMPMQDQVFFVLNPSCRHPLLAHVVCVAGGLVGVECTNKGQEQWRHEWPGAHHPLYGPIPQPIKPTAMQAKTYALLYTFYTCLNQSECLLHEHIFIKYFITLLFHLH